MKLTTTLILALSTAVASAATTTYTPLTNAEGWEYGSRNATNFSLNATTGTLSLTGSNWGQQRAYKTIDAISLSAADTLTFSFDLYNNDKSCAFSVALVGNTQAIVAGTLIYDSTRGKGPSQYAVTSVLPDDFDTGKAPNYTSEQIASADIKTLASTPSYLSDTLTYNATIKWDDTTDQFVMDITAGDVTASSITLGQTVDINQIYISGDGNSGSWGWNLSNFSLAVTTPDVPSGNIPEPATATLSLLALAGLAARRRRK